MDEKFCSTQSASGNGSELITGPSLSWNTKNVRDILNRDIIDIDTYLDRLFDSWRKSIKESLMVYGHNERVASKKDAEDN